MKGGLQGEHIGGQMKRSEHTNENNMFFGNMRHMSNVCGSEVKGEGWATVRTPR